MSAPIWSPRQDRSFSATKTARSRKLPGYAIFGLHTSYQVAKHLQIYGLVQNIFDQRFYTAGSLFDTGQFPNSLPNLTDPRTMGPGKPFAIYGGLRITL